MAFTVFLFAGGPNWGLPSIFDRERAREFAVHRSSGEKTCGGAGRILILRRRARQRIAVAAKGCRHGAAAAMPVVTTLQLLTHGLFF
jgi:hypothetical protein